MKIYHDKHQGILIYLPCLLVRRWEFLTTSIKNSALLLLLLLFATTRSVIKSVKVFVVEVAKRTNWFHHRSSGDKSVGCVVQANRCLTSCGEAPQSVQMRLVRLTPYACSPAIYGSVLTVVVRECLVVFCWVSAARSIFGDGRFFSTLLFPWSWISESTACVCRFWWISILLESSLGRTVEWCLEYSLLHGSWYFLSCDAMTDVVLLQTVHKVLRRKHIWVVLDFQREGHLVEMVNTGHLVGPVRRPQIRILRCLYLLKARVTCPATITRKCDQPRSFIVQTPNGTTLLRNRFHLCEMYGAICSDASCIIIPAIHIV